MTRTEELYRYYRLEKHPEGGAFAEVYEAPFASENGRALSGSIYFMLENGDISHFHQIDCDELWYYHEGCGLKITMLMEDGTCRTALLGPDMSKGEEMMVAVPAGAIFAAENTDKSGYTFISCMTTPQFTYRTFRLVGTAEIREKYPDVSEELSYLIDPDTP